MKVLHLLTQPTGGPADHVADVAPALAALGHDVVVYLPDGAAARRLPVRWVPFRIPSKTDVRGLAALAGALRRERPDVLHCQDRRAGLMGRLAARAAGVPGVVFTLHGAPDGLAHLVRGNLRAGGQRRRDRLYYLTAERWLARLGGGRIVAPSRAIADFLTGPIGVPADRVDVVRNGVDAARFAVPARPARDPVVLWLGLMGAVKRLDLLVEALARTPGLRAVLAGDGPLRGEVEAAVAAAGLADRVSFPGFVADPVPLFTGADLFVLSSAAENCPLALLQAMATGLPSVVTSVGGVPEVVRDGVEGLVVPPGSAGALASALGTLAAAPASRASFGAAARRRIESAFTVERCAEGLDAVYRRAVAR